MDKHLSIAKWVASAVLLLALFEMPIGYYTFVRLTCGPILLFMAFAAFKAERIPWAWCYGLLGLLYNPILPVYLGDKGPWGAINAATIVCLLIGERPKRERTNKKKGGYEGGGSESSDSSNRSNQSADSERVRAPAGVRTHYDNLQVARNASPEVIKGAYKYLSKRWHPDKNPYDRLIAEKNLKLINRAYAVLSDPVKRTEHDRWIAEQLEISPPSEPKTSASSWPRSTPTADAGSKTSSVVDSEGSGSGLFDNGYSPTFRGFMTLFIPVIPALILFSRISSASNKDAGLVLAAVAYATVFVILLKKATFNFVMNLTYLLFFCAILLQGCAIALKGVWKAFGWFSAHI